MDLEKIWPPFALRIRAGDMVMSPVREADYSELADIAEGGVRKDGVPAFLINWDSGSAEEIARSIAQYQWSTRANFHVNDWTIEFTVRVAGRAVSVQGISAKDFAATRCISTGSWLALLEQGQGYGTRMRAATVAAFADAFDVETFHSAYFEGNEASRRVSEKLGYSPNGVATRVAQDGHASIEHQVILAASDFNRSPDRVERGPDRVEIEGAEAVRRFLGLAPSGQ